MGRRRRVDERARHLHLTRRYDDSVVDATSREWGRHPADAPPSRASTCS